MHHEQRGKCFGDLKKLNAGALHFILIVTNFHHSCNMHQRNEHGEGKKKKKKLDPPLAPDPDCSCMNKSC